ncbi:MAG: CcdB family protein [Casimicrobiaceae bacterium]
MAQFDVYRNANAAQAKRIPFVVDVQSDLLDHLATRVVVPLADPKVLDGKPAKILNPAFAVEGRKVVMLTPELAGIPRKALGLKVAALHDKRAEIVAALDVIFSGV